MTRRAGLAVETPVLAIVLEHPECAAVLDRYRISYDDPRSLDAVCRERRVAPTKILYDCELAVQRREPDVTDPTMLSTHALITKVIGRHHRYLHRTLPFLQKLAHDVGRAHGDAHPELRALLRLVDTLAQVLLSHLDDEERTVFPGLLSPDVEIAPLLARMQAGHAEVGDLLSTLRGTTGDYACPAGLSSGGCQILMRELAYLEADTREHITLENDVLRPRFVAAPTS